LAITLSSVARTALDQMFTGLDGVLQKGAAAAKAKGVEEAVYLGWRLAPDMFPLTAQVQFATEIPARGLSRLAGLAIPSFGEGEKSFQELRHRIAAARAHIDALPAEAMDAEPERIIVVPMGPEERTFTRIGYLQNFILPNVYFHATAAYLILRHLGVDVGKRDFLAAPPQ
jgi:hypothetical protein